MNAGGSGAAFRLLLWGGLPVTCGYGEVSPFFAQVAYRILN
jgi:hypothetical protein